MPSRARRGRNAEQEELWKSDAWRMQHMKVQPCHKRYAHDWSCCPFGHPREAARRRDPQLGYTGIACPAMKQDGQCELGDACPFAHNVFEYWLHPTRYRTQLCNDGSQCRRWLCFFAHGLEELRVPECKPWLPTQETLAAAAAAGAATEAAAAAGDPGKLQHLASASPAPMGVQEALQGSQQQQWKPPPSPAQQQQQQQPRRAPRGPSLDMDLPSPADVAAHQAYSAALQQPRFQQQAMGQGQLVDLVLGLMGRGEVSADRLASILQRLLPPEALEELQEQLESPDTCMWETRRYSDPSSYFELCGQPSQLLAPPAAALHKRNSADSAVGSSLGWAAVPPAACPMPPGRLSAQHCSLQPTTPLLLEQLAALQVAAGRGTQQLQATAAARLRAAGGVAHPFLPARQPVARLPCHLASRQSSLDSAPSSLGQAGDSSAATSPSRCSLEGRDADAASSGEGQVQPGLRALPTLGLGSPRAPAGSPFWGM